MYTAIDESVEAGEVQEAPEGAIIKGEADSGANGR